MMVAYGSTSKWFNGPLLMCRRRLGAPSPRLLHNPASITETSCRNFPSPGGFGLRKCLGADRAWSACVGRGHSGPAASEGEAVLACA